MEVCVPLSYITRRDNVLINHWFFVRIWFSKCAVDTILIPKCPTTYECHGTNC